MGKSEGVAQPSRSVFTCQIDLLGTWMCRLGLPPRDRVTPGFSATIAPTISPITLACHSRPSRGATVSFLSRCMSLRVVSSTQQYTAPVPATTSLIPVLLLSASLVLQKEPLLREPVDPRETMHALDNHLGLASVSFP